MPKTDGKGLEIAGMAGNALKFLYTAGIAENACKWLKMALNASKWL